VGRTSIVRFPGVVPTSIANLTSPFESVYASIVLFTSTVFVMSGHAAGAPQIFASTGSFASGYDLPSNGRIATWKFETGAPPSDTFTVAFTSSAESAPLAATTAPAAGTLVLSNVRATFSGSLTRKSAVASPPSGTWTRACLGGT
jgi:hypothetical protein